MEDEEVDGRGGLWPFLPHPALFKIFSYLDYKQLVSAGTVCRNWNQVSKDEFLWRELFYENFYVRRSVPIVTGKSWFGEFKRLCYDIPVIQTETLQDHSHQVLHVSFSHNGKYFATCSKDGYVILWDSSYPASIKHHKDMKTFSWKYTQYSQFNESDTLLLVSGVHFGTPHSTSGEIAVFSLQVGFQLQCRVVNKPYDIFGTWYSDQHLLSGDLHWLAHLVSASYLWLNKASQETDSEHVPVTHNMYRFYNRHASSIRSIMIAKCLPNSEQALLNRPPPEKGTETKKPVVFEHGNPVSHRDLNLANVSHNYMAFDEKIVGKMDPEKVSLGNEVGYPIWYDVEYRRVESEMVNSLDETDSLLDEMDEDDEKSRSGSSDDENSECSSVDGDQGDHFLQTDKYLIFTTGFKTYTPHQIGFKRIKPFSFPKRIDPGPSLRERLVLHEKKKEMLKSGSPPPEPNWLDFEEVADKFDKVDHLIDLHGHIVGMGLSPNHRYLYVNCRSWPFGYEISNPLDPPPIAQEIDIHVIDLVTLKQVGQTLRAHKAYTPNNECFFIFLDVCNEYVASGAEDKHGYLWDRHYGVCVAKYPHADVVNSVAFNPKDSSMLVTTSDDNTIKVWRSRSKVKELGLNEAQFQRGVELRNGKKRLNFNYHNSNSNTGAPTPKWMSKLGANR